MSICFSLLVHERPEVVRAQVFNFLKYVDGCSVILHLSAGWKDNFLRAAERNGVDLFGIPGVHVNPVSHGVQKVCFGYLEAHSENFAYAERHIPDFGFFCLQASNVLFVRRGVQAYMEAWRNGLEKIPVHRDMEWPQGQLAARDAELQRLADSRGWRQCFGSHIEGTFYERDKFREIVRASQEYQTDRNFPYAREEFVFPTIYHNVWPDVPTGSPVTAYFWDGATQAKVTKVIEGRPGFEHAFSFKRVERRLTDPLFQWVMTLA